MNPASACGGGPSSPALPSPSLGAAVLSGESCCVQFMLPQGFDSFFNPLILELVTCYDDGGPCSQSAGVNAVQIRLRMARR